MRTKQVIFAEMRKFIDKCKAEGRDMTAEEVREYDKLEGELDTSARSEELDRRERETDPELLKPIRDVRMLPGYRGGITPKNKALTRSQSIADHAKVTHEQRGLSFGKYMKGLVTGDWKGAEEERALSIGSGSAGGYLVPTPLAAGILDLARNKARVMQAGALTVPMENSTLKLAKIAGDPTAAWHSEAGTITPSDGVLDIVTLTAKTLTSIVKFSRELWEDVDNLDAILTDMFSNAMALELDRAALYGSGTDPEPSGLSDQIADASQANTSMGANGGFFTSFDPIIDAVVAIENANYEPNAMIYAPRTGGDLAKLKDENNNPLTQPEMVANLAKYVTKQVPVNRTQGSANNASDIFVGQWNQLLIGMRMEFSVGLLDQLYAGTGQYGMWAWLRADIQPAHIAAFNKIVGIIPPG